MLIYILLVILGFGLLIKGADWFVDGAVGLARRSGMSDLAIGLTIVAFGTSAPELVVNLNAMLQGHSEIVLANVIGSNNFNIFVIIGITGLIYPIVVQSSTVWKEIPFSFGVMVLVFCVSNDWHNGESGHLSRWDALILLSVFAAFLFYISRQLKNDSKKPSDGQANKSPGKIWLMILGGLSALTFGGRVVVDNVVELAYAWGMSERVIGLTVVAAGTSLPELATSLVAAFKKNSDIAVGNIIGSNVFNLLLVLGLSTFVSPIAYESSFNIDMTVSLIGTILVFIAMFTGKRGILDRWEAGFLLLAFVFYTGYTINLEL